VLSKSNPQRIITSYLLIAGLYTLSASVIWGVNTLFLMNAGLTIAQVFVVNAIFTGAMALFEIPTGVLADTKGRRTSFLLSVVVLSIGTLGYVGAVYTDRSMTLALLIAFSIVLGLGYTFYSGAVEAWLVDALDATGFDGDLDHVFAQGSMVSGAAMLIGSIGGGLLGTVDLALPYWTRAALLAIVFIVAWFLMHDLGFTPKQVGLARMPAEMVEVARVSIRYGWQQPSVRLLMMIAFVQGLFMAWGFYAWQPYFLALLGQDLPWVAGVIAALISLATIAGNEISEVLIRFANRRTMILWGAAVLQTVALFGVGLAGSFWLAVGFYLLSMLAMGVWSPVRQAYLHRLIPSEQRATVVSFDSMVSSGGSMVGQTGLGQLAQVQSFGAGYVVSGLASAMAWPLLAMLRRRADKADLVVHKTGQRSACAGQGLPCVATVDAAARQGTAAPGD
jgi:MFS family permease